MIVTILGNGPSRERWDGSGDVKISCNLELEGVDFVASCHATSFSWMQTPTIHKITRWPRCCPTIHEPPATVKRVEGRNPHYWKVGNLVVHKLCVYASQKMDLDSGDVAIIWARHTYPQATIHLWGFDSLWGNLHNITYNDTMWHKSKTSKHWPDYSWIKVCGAP